MLSNNSVPLYKYFLFSSLFFGLCTLLGVYERLIYSYGYFAFYWILELIFLIGLTIKKISFRKKRIESNYTFCLTRKGKNIITFLNICSLLAFIYFLYLYGTSIGINLLGTFTAATFEDEGRTSLEKFSLLVMQLGGDAAYLVSSCDKSFKGKRRRLSTLCLFLPGLRYLLMGARYAIAVETLLYFVINGVHYNVRKLTLKKLFSGLAISTMLIALFSYFLYLFDSRAVFSAVEKYEFYPGDMQLYSIFERIYYATNGKIDFLYSFSDYLAEAPYVFSFYCLYGIPEEPFYGIMFFRPLIKTFSFLFDQDYYSLITNSMMSGKYSGCYYPIICDFGLYVSPVIVFLYGIIFSQIEKYSWSNKICFALLPAVKVMCIFAPVYYFYVGRLDFTVFFAIVLSLVCLRRVNDEK